MKPIFIAEVKTESPFGYKSVNSFDYLFNIANKYGEWISILTDPRWAGSLDLIRKVRFETRKPIVAKGFNNDVILITEALREGAQFVLTVDFIPQRDLADCCLMEFSTYAKLMRAVNIYPNGKFVYNNRNIKTGYLRDKNEYDDYRRVTRWLCQASFIYDKDDVDNEADAFIVGTYLPEFVREIKK